MLGSKKRKPRTVVIGLDGVPFGLIRKLADDGVMPAMRSLIAGGRLSPMASSIPAISSIAWSTLITGKNPGEHGILGFMELARGTYSLTFPNFRSLKAPPFWTSVARKKCAVLNVPSTYPARELNGAMIAGFVALDLEQATWPRSLVPGLRAREYRLDVDSRLAHKDMPAFLADLDDVLDARIETYKWLWDREKWDLFMAVFTGTDRLMHFLFDAVVNADHEHHNAFLHHFHRIDVFLRWVLDRMGEDDSLLMLSDHGFELLQSEVYVNSCLREWGFLKMEKDPPEGPEDIGAGTRAFALDPARVYVNLEGKYPRGCVKESEKEGLLEELEEAFNGLEIEGRKVVKEIYRKDRIYHGPETVRAADLILMSEPGFDLKATFRESALHGRRAFTGKHTRPDAFLLVKPGKKAEVEMPDKPAVQDVAGLILACMTKGGQPWR